MAWTNEQLMAISKTGSNIIVSAGAGSGKTAVLSERVLEKLKSGVNINEILILTFTNAAAFEMATRIKNKIKENNELAYQLEIFDSAYITTFDSFALAMLRKYHYAKNLSPNISVIEEALVKSLKEKIIDEIFEEKYLNMDKDFLKLIGDFGNKDDSLIKEYILNINEKLDLKINKEDYLKGYLDKHFNDSNIFNDVKMYETLIIKKIDLIKEYLKDLSFLVDSKYYISLEESLKNLLNAKTYDEIVLNLNVKMPNLPRNSEDEVKDLKEKIGSVIKTITKLCKYQNTKEIKENIFKTYDYVKAIIDIILALDIKLNAFKYENDLYEFNDIAKMIIEIFIKYEDIRLEVKESFKEIMIDEYQDTNDIQELFISLISDNNVYMVGDIKQSIYRFRNANPNIFKEKYSKYTDLNGGLKIDLNKNFRSRSEVLDNINLIFNHIMDLNYGGAEYKNSHQMIFGNSSYNIEGKTSQDNNFEILNYNTNEMEGFKKEEIEAFIIVNDIKNKILNHYQVYDKDKKVLRDVTLNDFAILMDKSKHFNLYKKIFEYHQIPLTLFRDLKITDEMILMLLKNVLKLILKIKNNELDTEFKYLYTSVSRSPLLELSDQEIFLAFKNDSFKETDLYLKCFKLKDKIDHMSIADFINLVLADFDFINNLSKVGNVKSNISKLEYVLNSLNVFSNIGFTIVEFIEYLGNIIAKEYDIKISENKDSKDSVKMMTIHKSKGLEYHICYYPGLYNKFNLSDLNDLFLYSENYGIITPYKDEGITNTIYKELLKDEYLKEEISEKIRLFYVALTRAKEKMILLVDNFSEVPIKNKITSLDKEEYRSFKDIVVSLKKYLLDYTHDLDLESLNLTKTYNQIKKDNYKNYLTDEFIEIKVDELKISNSEVLENKYSKNLSTLITKDVKNNLEFGLRMHELLEIIDFKNPDFSDLSITNYEKNKIISFLNQEVLKDIKNAQIYKEYEFMTLENDTIYHGIIDLMLVYHDHVDIIDYKLKNVDDEAYLKQLDGYKKYVISKLKKPAKIYLYSIVDDKIKKIA